MQSTAEGVSTNASRSEVREGGTYPNSIRILSTSPFAVVDFELEATGALEYPRPFVVGVDVGASAVILSMTCE